MVFVALCLNSLFHLLVLFICPPASSRQHTTHAGNQDRGHYRTSHPSVRTGTCAIIHTHPHSFLLSTYHRIKIPQAKLSLPGENTAQSTSQNDIRDSGSQSSVQDSLDLAQRYERTESAVTATILTHVGVVSFSFTGFSSSTTSNKTAQQLLAELLRVAHNEGIVVQVSY
jgi:hypothetical protein